VPIDGQLREICDLNFPIIRIFALAGKCSMPDVCGPLCQQRTAMFASHNLWIAASDASESLSGKYSNPTQPV
jgi:hypothetical protein